MSMKKIGSLILSLVFSVVTFAISRDSLNAVTMVAYEQSYSDNEGTLALKNNTDEEIYNVIYRITYLDMSGNPLDYEDFSSEVRIAPGMTKKVDIPAYEHNRYYSYYKSESLYDNSRRFKVKFELKGYNLKQGTFEETEEMYASSGFAGENDWSYGIGVIVAVLLFFGIWIGMYVLVAVMARQRQRSAAVWVLLSLIATPLLMAFILLCIGKASNGRKEGFD